VALDSPGDGLTLCVLDGRLPLLLENNLLVRLNGCSLGSADVPGLLLDAIALRDALPVREDVRGLSTVLSPDRSVLCIWEKIGSNMVKVHDTCENSKWYLKFIQHGWAKGSLTYDFLQWHRYSLAWPLCIIVTLIHRTRCIPPSGRFACSKGCRRIQICGLYSSFDTQLARAEAQTWGLLNLFHRRSSSSTSSFTCLNSEQWRKDGVSPTNYPHVSNRNMRRLHTLIRGLEPIWGYFKMVQSNT
jgi:hypothetical protein